MTRMNSVWTIARHEYGTNVRRAGFIVFTLLVPALGVFGLVLAAFFAGETARFFADQFTTTNRLPLGVVDRTGLFVPIAPEHAAGFVAFDDETQARAALAAEAIGGFVVIPADYVQTGDVAGYTRGGLSGAANLDTDVLNGFLLDGLLKGRVDAATRTRASNPANLTPFAVDTGQDSAVGLPSVIVGFVIPYALSIFLLVSIFVASNYLLRSVSEEKETRVIEVVLSSVTPGELLAGKVIGLGALGLTQVGVWLLSGVLLSGGFGALLAGAAIALNPMTFVLATVYFLLGYVVYGTLMAAAGSLGTSMRESQQLAGIFSFMAAIPWMINGFLLMNPNATVARVLSYFPLTAPTMMMLRLAIGGVPAVDIVGSILVLLVSIPFVLWAGAKVFRMGLLMYGKRPALAQVWRALREA